MNKFKVPLGIVLGLFLSVCHECVAQAPQKDSTTSYAVDGNPKQGPLFGHQGRAGRDEGVLQKDFRITRLIVYYGPHGNHDVLLGIDVFAKTREGPENLLKAFGLRNKKDARIKQCEFKLAENEWLTAVDLTIGHWIDNVKFTTNIRQSDVIGFSFGGQPAGLGHETPHIVVPDGQKIVGLGVEFDDKNAMSGFRVFTGRLRPAK